MTIYTVHQRQEGDFEPLLVGHRFSWAAFAFGPAWFAARRMWLAAVVLLLADLGTIAAAGRGRLSIGAAMLIILAVGLVVGAEASELRRRAAMRRGRQISGIVVASDEFDAAARVTTRLYLDGGQP